MSKRLSLAGALGALALLAFACQAHTAAQTQTVQKGNLRVRFSGALAPQRLPRQGTRPVTVTLGGNVATTDGSEPPQLRKIEIAINRHGKIDSTGLPSCRLEEIQPSTNQDALAACGDAKVGEGRFFANVAIPGQAPFPSKGKLIAFNGTEHGHPVIFAHVYGSEPVPTSYTLVLRIGKAKGTFATTLSAALPHVTGKAGFITGIELTLHRSFSYRGHQHGYVSASCPLPKGLSVAPFKLARTSFSFAGRRLGSVLMGVCRAGG